ncbi:NAD(P)H-dependent oxidoreductase [Lachnospira multipara]|nr:NAD(P)H-dependent oxidoreductase [Lachnospira multipara]
MKILVLNGSPRPNGNTAGMGIFTNHDKNVMSRIKDMASSL